MPPLVQLPFTVKIFDPATVSVAPVPMFKLLHAFGLPSSRIMGCTPSEGMITSFPASGTMPPHQLDPLFQSASLPNQVPGIQDDTLTFKTPVAVDPK